jgi:DNA polymerase III delta subunit
MIYLFLGDSRLAKDQKIEEIKHQVLLSNEALKFDYEILYAEKLGNDILKQALNILPAVSIQRLLLIHSVSKFTSDHKRLIVEFIQTKNSKTVLILDSDEDKIDESFLEKIKSLTQILRFSSRPKSSVFDMTNAMAARNCPEALKVLAELFEQGEHPLQIMGVLVWFWGQCRRRVSEKVYKNGLLDLQEADLNIKRSRLQPEQSVEVLVVKLCSLIIC